MKPPCILVVDDNDDLRQVIAFSLEIIAGWCVLQARDGVHAIELATRNQPDAILLDVMMPGMDGPATLHVLKATRSTRQIPVVFLTAKARGAIGEPSPVCPLRQSF